MPSKELANARTTDTAMPRKSFAIVQLIASREAGSLPCTSRDTQLLYQSVGICSFSGVENPALGESHLSAAHIAGDHIDITSELAARSALSTSKT